nr:hypothetical protein Iba_chr05bCG3400 [Ipomoea batatas]
MLPAAQILSPPHHSSPVPTPPPHPPTALPTPLSPSPETRQQLCSLRLVKPLKLSAMAIKWWLSRSRGNLKSSFCKLQLVSAYSFSVPVLLGPEETQKKKRYPPRSHTFSASKI